MNVTSYSHKSPLSEEPTWEEIQAQELKDLQESLAEEEELERRFNLPKWHSEHPDYENYCKEKEARRLAGIETSWVKCLDAFERIRQVEDPLKRDYVLLQEWHEFKHRLHKADFKALYQKWVKTQEVTA